MDKGLDRNVSTFQDAVMDFTLSDNQALFTKKDPDTEMFLTGKRKKILLFFDA
jgi:hypothetical protein